MVAIDRKKLKEQMMARSQESYQSKDQGDKYAAYFTAPPGMPIWKCGEGEHTIDVLSWIVGAQYPTSETYRHVKQGDFAYVLDIWVHNKVGMDENAYPCLLKNWGERCPVCEDIVRLIQEGVDEKILQPKKAKRRSLYYILVYDSDTEYAKGVQLFEIYHGFFQQKIASRSKLPHGGGTVLFALPDSEGKQIYFERTGMGKTSTAYENHQFLNREYEIEDDVWINLTPLDELVQKKSFEEIYEAHFGTPYTGDAPKTTSAPAAGIPSEAPIAGKTTRPGVFKPKPAAKKAAPTAKKAAPTVKPVAKKAAPASRPSLSRPAQAEPAAVAAEEDDIPFREEENPFEENECPAGGTFGIDINTPLSDCETCELWDDCAAKANELEA